MSVFDLLDISLVHGWLVDPQDGATKEEMADLSYNQLMELMIEYEDVKHKVLQVVHLGMCNDTSKLIGASCLM
jgi:hypothetical protein